jgi:hypothetical protein
MLVTTPRSRMRSKVRNRLIIGKFPTQESYSAFQQHIVASVTTIVNYNMSVSAQSPYFRTRTYC